MSETTSPGKYHPKVVGEKCYLSPMSSEDAAIYTRWFNDLEVQKNLLIPLPIITVESEREWLAAVAKRNDVLFAVIDKGSDTLIGNVGFHNLDQTNRCAEFGIVIGEKEFWNRGYGSEATRLTLDYGFNVLNLHNVMLRVFAYNDRGLACYRKCGFREIGRRREAKWIAGHCWDEVFMDILDIEFVSPFVQKLFR